MKTHGKYGDRHSAMRAGLPTAPNSNGRLPSPIGLPASRSRLPVPSTRNVPGFAPARATGGLPNSTAQSPDFRKTDICVKIERDLKESQKKEKEYLDEIGLMQKEFQKLKADKENVLQLNQALSEQLRRVEREKAAEGKWAAMKVHNVLRQRKDNETVAKAAASGEDEHSHYDLLQENHHLKEDLELLLADHAALVRRVAELEDARA